MAKAPEALLKKKDILGTDITNIVMQKMGKVKK